MKVIKKGTGQKGWAKEFTCTGKGSGGGGCGAILFVESNDLFSRVRVATTARGQGIFLECVAFECIECKVITDVWEKGFEVEGVGDPGAKAACHHDKRPSKRDLQD